ncbi:MAG: FprA family A-type flavoprotein [Lentisphaeria bacterium]|nr:FprA family A-type flavoprotein [Lentisphaeria bacterium]
MKQFFKAVQISENTYWVGAIDWNVKNFHGYTTNRGTTYNAFLILDEKVTLIDTVKAPFYDELMARISSVIDPEKIDYIISNHSEPDHSGALERVVNAVKPEKVFASPMGQKTLKAYFGEDFQVETMKTGDTLNIGKNTIAAVETKMVHWPDSMVTYATNEKVLFSQDAFGMHLATSKLFSDENDRSILNYEVKKYFANILLHLSPQVAATIAALPKLNLDIQVIAPDHGPLWRTQDEMNYIVNLYKELTEQQAGKKAVVFYNTMWTSTAKMAAALSDGLRDGNLEVKLIDLGGSDRSEVITEVFDSAIVCAGAPTMNNQVYPAMADILTYVKGLRPKNKIGFAFGSFGWSGEGHKFIQNTMADMKFELPFEPYSCKYMPTEKNLEEIFNIGKSLAELVNNK